jgi:hypothetical protein
MGFAPLEEIEGPIVLPLRGREYTLPVISFEQGLALQHRITEGIAPGELAAELLGDVLTDLATAGASPELIQRVTMVALAEWKFGRAAAEEAWRDPKAPLELIKVLRQAYAAAQTTPTAEETTTPPPASGSGTRKTPRKATPSPGKRS